MKYVITGSAGHISKPLALQLLKAGHTVTVIGRTAKNLTELTNAGAVAAIGAVEDIAFLTNTFTGADAVYAMVPPNFAAKKWQEYIALIGSNYANAIKASGVQHVVVLSSIGAHMPTGCGPVSGLHFVEKHFNALVSVHVKYLRPAFFYYNHLSSIATIKAMGIMGGNYGNNNKISMTATEDIAAVAAEELQSLSFTEKSIRYIVSDEKTTNEIASILGEAIDKPTLPWVDLTDEQLLGGMLQAGLPAQIAHNYVEMGVAMRTGKMNEDFELHRANTHFSNTKFETFAQQFASIYNTN